MKFRELMESLQGDFQIRIRKAQKGEAGEIMKEIERLFGCSRTNFLDEALNSGDGTYKPWKLLNL